MPCSSSASSSTSPRSTRAPSASSPRADASERAFEHARRADDVFEQREIVEWLAIVLFLGPTPASEAADRCRQLLEDMAGDRVLEVHILSALAFLVAMQGHEEEAHELIARGQRVMQELGEWIWIYSWHYAAICLWQGNPVAAHLRMRGGNSRERRPLRDRLARDARKGARAQG